MTITISAFTLEIYLFQSLYIKTGRHECYFKREPQNPLRFFSRLSHGAAGVEVWGLGWSGVWNKA